MTLKSDNSTKSACIDDTVVPALRLACHLHTPAGPCKALPHKQVICCTAAQADMLMLRSGNPLSQAAPSRCPHPLQAAQQQQRMCSSLPSALLAPLLLCAFKCPTQCSAGSAAAAMAAFSAACTPAAALSGRPVPVTTRGGSALRRHGRADHLVHGLDDLLRLHNRRRLQLECVGSRHVLGAQPDDL